MPATLSKIRGLTGELDIYLGDPDVPVDSRDPDESFHVVYRRHALTAKMDEMSRQAEKDGEAFSALCELCVPLFVRWDLRPGATDAQMEELELAHESGDHDRINRIEEEIRETTEAQNVVPIEKESLKEFVPASILVMILDQIGQANRPKAETGSRSRKR